MSETLDDALAEYLRASAKNKTDISAPIAEALASGLRIKLEERSKFNNILNQIVANEGFVHGQDLARKLGAEWWRIHPYPLPGGSVSNFQFGVPAPQVVAAPEPKAQPVSSPAKRRGPKWLWPLVAAAGLTTAAGLGGYLLGQGDEPPPVVTPDSDANVGVEIDG